jgi:hypothetical protein
MVGTMLDSSCPVRMKPATTADGHPSTASYGTTDVERVAPVGSSIPREVARKREAVE